VLAGHVALDNKSGSHAEFVSTGKRFSVQEIEGVCVHFVNSGSDLISL